MEETHSRSDLVWSILLLFGCFCIGFNAAIAFHELGHAFAMVLDGVRVREFFLSPFSWSWTFPESLNHPTFTAFGGVSFGLVFAVLPSIASIWIRSAYLRIPAFITAAFAFAINGIYLVAGTLLEVGDGGELVQYGVPHVVLLSLGGLYLIVALSLLTVIQPLLGITRGISFAERLLIIGAGVVPYLLLMFIFNLFMNRDEILLWSTFILAGVVFLLLLSAVGQWGAGMQRWFRGLRRSEVGWGPVIMALALGFIIIVGELVVFGIKDSPF